MTRPKQDQSAEARDSRKSWDAPKVTRMVAGEAENVGPFGADGVIGSS